MSPRALANDHGVAEGEAGSLMGTPGFARGAPSDCDCEGFFDDVSAVRPVGDGAVGFQRHNKGFFQILLCLGKGFALCVNAGNFFDVGDVPAAALVDDRSERLVGVLLSLHSKPILA